MQAEIRDTGANPPGVAEAFDALGEVIYLNNASVAPGCRPAVEALSEVVDEWAHGTFDFVTGERAGDEARSLFAELIGSPTESIALIPTVSAVAGLLANHLALQRMGGNIVVGAEEFTSNLFSWRLLENHGYGIRLVPFEAGRLSADGFARAADADTRLVAVSAVQSASGSRAGRVRLSLHLYNTVDQIDTVVEALRS